MKRIIFIYSWANCNDIWVGSLVLRLLWICICQRKIRCIHIYISEYFIIARRRRICLTVLYLNFAVFFVLSTRFLLNPAIRLTGMKHDQSNIDQKLASLTDKLIRCVCTRLNLSCDVGFSQSTCSEQDIATNLFITLTSFNSNGAQHILSVFSGHMW